MPRALRTGTIMSVFRSYEAIPAASRLVLVALIVSSLTGINASAREERRSAIPKLNNDHLGESLKRFQSLHRQANCVRRPIKWPDARSLKMHWLLWVDCSLEKGVTFEGRELLAEADPTRPFGILASFYEKKLVELSYTLSTESIDVLLPILNREYGEASHTTYDRAGHAAFVTWAGRVASLDVELVPVPRAIAEGNFLRIGEGPPSSAVRIRTRLNDMPSSDP